MMHQLIDKKNKIILYLLFLVILSTTSGKFSQNHKNYSYKINQINIQGLSNVHIKKISGELNYLFHQNILFARKEEIQRVISKYNIIEEFSIKKVYPSTINIYIQPTQFVARLSNNGQLVGSNGKLIENKKNNDLLPYIFGKFNSNNFLKFKKNIERSNFSFAKLKTLYFFPSNRWDILTYDNILIKLPQDDISKSLDIAFKIISSNNFKDKNLIDLRVNNNLIMK